MIEVLASLISIVVTLMKVDLTILGFTFSLWQVLIYVLVAGIVIDLIGRFLDGK